MRKVVVPPEIFVATILREAATKELHVMKWSITYPQMADALWRNDVENIFSRLHRNKFTNFKFYGPDDLDEDWMFIATKKEGAWHNITEENVHKVVPEYEEQAGDGMQDASWGWKELAFLAGTMLAGVCLVALAAWLIANFGRL